MAAQCQHCGYPLRTPAPPAGGTPVTVERVQAGCGQLVVGLMVFGPIAGVLTGLGCNPTAHSKPTFNASKTPRDGS